MQQAPNITVVSLSLSPFQIKLIFSRSLDPTSMSLMTYGNDGTPTTTTTTHDASTASSSPGAIVQHPYLNSNAYSAAAAVAAAAAAAAASPSSIVAQYPHYYGHSQQLFNVQPGAGFYPTAGPPNPHQHHGEFGTSSPSIASSSSSVDSSRKTAHRRRNAEKIHGTGAPAKSNTKRKIVSGRTLTRSGSRIRRLVFSPTMTMTTMTTTTMTTTKKTSATRAVLRCPTR